MVILRPLFTITALIGMLYCAPADAFRCGNRIVVEGDDISHVHHICGEPTATQFWTELRVRPVFRYSHFLGNLPTEIQVEEWTYNLGARRFMRRLRFENGQLVDIRELRYGH